MSIELVLFFHSCDCVIQPFGCFPPERSLWRPCKNVERFGQVHSTAAPTGRVLVVGHARPEEGQICLRVSSVDQADAQNPATRAVVTYFAECKEDEYTPEGWVGESEPENEEDGQVGVGDGI